MYVVYFVGEHSKTYHLSDELDHHNEFLKVLPHLEFIQVDGHELKAIQNLFQNNGSYSIPMPNTPVVTWYGDIAKTIHLNLINSPGFRFGEFSS